MESTGHAPSRPLVSLFGAPGDTGNLGVSALGESTIHGVREHRPDVQLLVFDNGRGRRTISVPGTADVLADGAWISRRLHRQESLWSMWASSLTGWPENRNVAAVRSSAAVLDATGGDSFTDLYGPRRWRLSILPKIIALRVGTPPVLLPRPMARLAVPGVAAELPAWCAVPTRPGHVTPMVLTDSVTWLATSSIPHDIGRVSTLLSRCQPAGQPLFRPPLGQWLANSGSLTMVGLNVSGLLMNDGRASITRFGLALDYEQAMSRLAERLLGEVADRLVLVPHVRGRGTESDDRACQRLAATLDAPDRVCILPSGLDAGTTKWFVSGLDWFCGTRMHSTIAALSSGVPAAAVAYSHKTRGVFATPCGSAHAVVDARHVNTSDAVDLLIDRAKSRDRDRQVLGEHCGAVAGRAREQVASIVDAVLGPKSLS